MTENRYPVIEFGGKPYQMGRQHGESAATLVARSLAVFRRLLEEDPYGNLPPAHHRASFEELVRYASESIPYTIDHAPHLVEEMQGIADGSGFTLEQIFALNACADLMITLADRSSPINTPVGCSATAISSKVSREGATLVGWCADDSEWQRSCSVILKGYPSDGLPFMSWSFAGTVGRPGLNPYLGLSANGLFPLDCGVGMPYPALCRLILNCRTVDEAVAVIDSTERMSGMNYLIADIDGAIACVETTARKHALVPDNEGKAAHTNHYTAPSLLASELRDQVDTFGNSISRLNRLGAVLNSGGDVGLETLFMAYRDHANSPDSVCHHAGRSEGDITSLVAMVCDPKAATMWVAYGNACTNEFVPHALRTS